MSGIPVDGERVKRLRTDQNLNQEALAVAAGVSVGFISRIEHGNRNCTRPVLDGVARALGVDADDLMLDFDEPLGARYLPGDVPAVTLSSGVPAGIAVRVLVEVTEILKDEGLDAVVIQGPRGQVIVGRPPQLVQRTVLGVAQ